MVDGQTLDVQYGYAISGTDNAKNFRANSVTYPNARVVKYDYGCCSNDTLNLPAGRSGRVHEIETSDGWQIELDLGLRVQSAGRPSLSLPFTQKDSGQ